MSDKTFTDILGVVENNVYVAHKKPKAKAKVNEIPKARNAFAAAATNLTHTENGAVTRKSSTSACIDWFFHGAAMRREKNINRILSMFETALQEDKTTALRILFYIRDIRGGQGERDIFRTCIKYLGDTDPEWITANIGLIAEYGRYDDYLCLLDTDCKDIVVDFLGAQLEKDLQHHIDGEIEKISLLAKWLPSENASSKRMVNAARCLLSTGKFGAVKSYRKALTVLRKDLNIVETKLSNKDYASIDYGKLPSYAGLKYRTAFYRGDETRYAKFINDVMAGNKDENGKVVTINASTLYPYDVLRPVIKTLRHPNYNYSEAEFECTDATLEAQWQALPDYVPNINGLVVCDTSGSMSGKPLEVAMSLALYVAERNKSEAWKNYVIPFSSMARFMEVKGESLAEKLASIYTGDCSNTNLRSVFDLILTRATGAKLKAEDMPNVLIIISDMEFDYSGNGCTNYEAITAKYATHGYEMPTIVWWNVDSRSNQSPVTVSDKGNILISGCSAAGLEAALAGEANLDEAMRRVIERDRYLAIQA